jgi:hypothetical protein
VGELKASFDGRSLTYGFGELDTLVPAYAATIHKSQGSEYPAVIIPVLTQHYAKSPLHRDHAWQEACGSRRPEEGHRDRRSECIGPATLVEAGRVARPVARTGYCFRRELKCDSDGVTAGLAVLRRLGPRNSPAAQDVPRVSAVRRSLIDANCLTRSAALAGLS